MSEIHNNGYFAPDPELVFAIEAAERHIGSRHDLLDLLNRAIGSSNVPETIKSSLCLVVPRIVSPIPGSVSKNSFRPPSTTKEDKDRIRPVLGLCRLEGDEVNFFFVTALLDALKSMHYTHADILIKDCRTANKMLIFNKDRFGSLIDEIWEIVKSYNNQEIKSGLLPQIASNSSISPTSIANSFFEAPTRNKVPLSVSVAAGGAAPRIGIKHRTVEVKTLNNIK